MAWGAQTRDSKSKTGMRTDDDGLLLWGAQTRRAKDGTPDEDSRQDKRDEKFTGTRKTGVFGGRKS